MRAIQSTTLEAHPFSFSTCQKLILLLNSGRRFLRPKRFICEQTRANFIMPGRGLRAKVTLGSSWTLSSPQKVHPPGINFVYSMARRRESAMKTVQNQKCDSSSLSLHDCYRRFFAFRHSLLPVTTLARDFRLWTSFTCVLLWTCAFGFCVFAIFERTDARSGSSWPQGSLGEEIYLSVLHSPLHPLTIALVFRKCALSERVVRKLSPLLGVFDVCVSSLSSHLPVTLYLAHRQSILLLVDFNAVYSSLPTMGPRSRRRFNLFMPRTHDTWIRPGQVIKALCPLIGEMIVVRFCVESSSVCIFSFLCFAPPPSTRTFPVVPKHQLSYHQHSPIHEHLSRHERFFS